MLDCPELSGSTYHVQLSRQAAARRRSKHRHDPSAFQSQACDSIHQIAGQQHSSAPPAAQQGCVEPKQCSDLQHSFRELRHKILRRYRKCQCAGNAMMDVKSDTDRMTDRMFEMRRAVKHCSTSQQTGKAALRPRLEILNICNGAGQVYLHKSNRFLVYKNRSIP